MTRVIFITRAYSSTVRAEDSSKGDLIAKVVMEKRDEFRETAAIKVGGNPEPSHRYTGGRCRDYLRATALLITG
jgi:hypothetical protein